MTIGIYCLQFEGTDKVYIGQSVNIERRYTQHKYDMSKNTAKYKLQEAYNLYGIPKLLILAECIESELNNLEVEAVDLYDSLHNGFNSTLGGSTGNSPRLSTKSSITKEQGLSILNLLIMDTLTAKEISKLVGVSVSIIRNISAGNQHKWLETEYPTEYKKLLELKNNRSTERRSTAEYSKIKDPTGNIHTVVSIKEFSTIHNLVASCLGKLLRGQVLSHKGWVPV